MAPRPPICVCEQGDVSELTSATRQTWNLLARFGEDEGDMAVGLGTGERKRVPVLRLTSNFEFVAATTTFFDTSTTGRL